MKKKIKLEPIHWEKGKIADLPSKIPLKIEEYATELLQCSEVLQNIKIYILTRDFDLTIQGKKGSLFK